jgi:hypothetical protein
MLVMWKGFREDISNDVICGNKLNDSLLVCHQVVPKVMVLSLDMLCPSSELHVLRQDNRGLIIALQKTGPLLRMTNILEEGA